MLVRLLATTGITTPNIVIVIVSIIHYCKDHYRPNFLAVGMSVLLRLVFSLLQVPCAFSAQHHSIQTE